MVLPQIEKLGGSPENRVELGVDIFHPNHFSVGWAGGQHLDILSFI